MDVPLGILLKKVDFNRGIIYNFCLMSLGALAMFLHAGCQVIAIDTIISYDNSMGIDLMEYKKLFLLIYWQQLICGHMLGIILIPKYVLKKNAHVFCMILNKFSISNLVTLDI
jgi:fucose permease